MARAAPTSTRWSSAAKTTTRPTAWPSSAPACALRASRTSSSSCRACPNLPDDLGVAISGQVEFVERGQRRDQIEEEQPCGGGNPAVLAHQRLVRAPRGRRCLFDARYPKQRAEQLRRVLSELADEPLLRRVTREVSAAPSGAHRGSDAPTAYWYYGPCLYCVQDIVQERA